MDADLYRKQYDFELSQRAQLTSNASIPITAATFLFGGVSALAMNYSYAVPAFSIAFCVLVGIALLALGIAIYFIFRSLLGHIYKKLPPLSQLQQHQQDIIEWHRANGSTEENANTDFEAYLRERLADAADTNSVNNINRSNFLYRATFTISISVVFICLSAIVFLSDHINADGNPQHVKIIGEVRVESGDPTDGQE